MAEFASDLKTHRCVECNYQPMNTDDLKAHMEGVHTTIEPFFCNSCDFTCEDENVMQAHVKEHPMTRTFFSQARPDRSRNHATTPSSRNEHRRSTPPLRTTQKLNKGNFKCTKCNEYFDNKDHFTLHMGFYHGSYNLETEQ